MFAKVSSLMQIFAYLTIQEWKQSLWHVWNQTKRLRHGFDPGSELSSDITRTARWSRSHGEWGGGMSWDSGRGGKGRVFHARDKQVDVKAERALPCLWSLLRANRVHDTARRQGTGYTTQWEDKRLDTNKWKGKTREVVQVDTETKQAGGQRETTTKIKCVLSVRQKSGTCGGEVGVCTCVSWRIKQVLCVCVCFQNKIYSSCSIFII